MRCVHKGRHFVVTKVQPADSILHSIWLFTSLHLFLQKVIANVYAELVGTILCMVYTYAQLVTNFLLLLPSACFAYGSPVYHANISILILFYNLDTWADFIFMGLSLAFHIPYVDVVFFSFVIIIMHIQRNFMPSFIFMRGIMSHGVLRGIPHYSVVIPGHVAYIFTNVWKWLYIFFCKSDAKLFIYLDKGPHTCKIIYIMCFYHRILQCSGILDVYLLHWLILQILLQLFIQYLQRFFGLRVFEVFGVTDAVHRGRLQIPNICFNIYYWFLFMVMHRSDVQMLRLCRHMHIGAKTILYPYFFALVFCVPYRNVRQREVVLCEEFIIDGISLYVLGRTNSLPYLGVRPHGACHIQRYIIITNCFYLLLPVSICLKGIVDGGSDVGRRVGWTMGQTFQHTLINLILVCVPINGVLSQRLIPLLYYNVFFYFLCVLGELWPSIGCCRYIQIYCHVALTGGKLHVCIFSHHSPKYLYMPGNIKGQCHIHLVPHGLQVQTLHNHLGPDANTQLVAFQVGRGVTKSQASFAYSGLYFAVQNGVPYWNILLVAMCVVIANRGADGAASRSHGGRNFIYNAITLYNFLQDTNPRHADPIVVYYNFPPALPNIGKNVFHHLCVFSAIQGQSRDMRWWLQRQKAATHITGGSTRRLNILYPIFQKPVCACHTKGGGGFRRVVQAVCLGFRLFCKFWVGKHHVIYAVRITRDFTVRAQLFMRFKLLLRHGAFDAMYVRQLFVFIRQHLSGKYSFRVQIGVGIQQKRYPSGAQSFHKSYGVLFPFIGMPTAVKQLLALEGLAVGQLMPRNQKVYQVDVFHVTPGYGRCCHADGPGGLVGWKGIQDILYSDAILISFLDIVHVVYFIRNVQSPPMLLHVFLFHPDVAVCLGLAVFLHELRYIVLIQCIFCFVRTMQQRKHIKVFLFTLTRIIAKLGCKFLIPVQLQKASAVSIGYTALYRTIEPIYMPCFDRRGAARLLCNVQKPVYLSDLLVRNKSQLRTSYHFCLYVGACTAYHKNPGRIFNTIHVLVHVLARDGNRGNAFSRPGLPVYYKTRVRRVGVLQVLDEKLGIMQLETLVGRKGRRVRVTRKKRSPPLLAARPTDLDKMCPQITNMLFLVDRRGNQRLILLSSRQLLQKVCGIQFGIR
ncbi:pD1133L [African swine fever virus]|uniref:PD1133L n=1 Tax=African swine fever virus TaxID=10497 RepID=A0A8A1V5Q5_ASF|nr:pD1133L [African swine fever virus]